MKLQSTVGIALASAFFALVLLIGTFHYSSCNEHVPVFITSVSHRTRGSSLTAASTPQASKIRLLCFVMGTVHQESLENVGIIESTWGKHCDVTLYVSSDPLPGIRETFLVDRIPNESSGNLYGKMLHTWKAIYGKYRDQADWFLKADDDTFIIVRNLKDYIYESFGNDSMSPRFLGRRFKLSGDSRNNFNSGGAGYVLNRAALDKFMFAVNTSQTPHCRYKEGAEDAYTTFCLRSIGIQPEDTRDALGRERFQSLKLEWLFDPKMHDGEPGWYQKYSYNMEKFEGCCSSQVISFHFLKPEDLRMYYYIFYGVQ